MPSLYGKDLLDIAWTKTDAGEKAITDSKAAEELSVGTNNERERGGPVL